MQNNHDFAVLLRERAAVRRATLGTPELSAAVAATLDELADLIDDPHVADDDSADDKDRADV